MAYFSKFPLTRYPFLQDSEVKRKLVVNVLRRVGISPELKNATEAFVEYTVLKTRVTSKIGPLSANILLKITAVEFHPKRELSIV